MSDTTNIAWATHTASPWFGCTEVDPCCANCYARELTLKHKWAGWGDNSPRVRSKGFWKDAYKWNRRAQGAAERPRVFTSLMDWLDAKTPTEWLADFMRVIRETPHLDWLLLTKRPQNFIHRLQSADANARLSWTLAWMSGSPPPNVWFGVTCGTQNSADVRIPILRTISAKVRWLSVEPILEPITMDLSGIHWVVVGGESGARRREPAVGTVAAIVDVVRQCRAANVPCFVKQDSGRLSGMQGRLPDDIWQIKQFPGLPWAKPEDRR